MTANTLSDPDQKIMSMKSFNFLCDTLQQEIMAHPHKDELIQLIHDQMCDDVL
jgi:hypothetical protein